MSGRRSGCRSRTTTAKREWPVIFECKGSLRSLVRNCCVIASAVNIFAIYFQFAPFSVHIMDREVLIWDILRLVFRGIKLSVQFRDLILSWRGAR